MYVVLAQLATVLAIKLGVVLCGIVAVTDSENVGAHPRTHTLGQKINVIVFLVAGISGSYTRSTYHK